MPAPWTVIDPVLLDAWRRLRLILLCRTVVVRLGLPALSPPNAAEAVPAGALALTELAVRRELLIDA